jgi:hypothetical protein
LFLLFVDIFCACQFFAKIAFFFELRLFDFRYFLTNVVQSFLLGVAGGNNQRMELAIFWREVCFAV